MKTLELNQMEAVEGGDILDAVPCIGAAAGIAALTVLAIAGGPVGWLAWGSALASGFATGASGAACAIANS